MRTFCAVLMAFVSAFYLLCTIISWQLYGSLFVTGVLAMATGFVLLWTIDLADIAAREQP